MRLWLDSKMDKYVLDYFKKALEYEIGIEHVDKLVDFGVHEAPTMTGIRKAPSMIISEYKLTEPQVNSAIKNLDRLLDLPVIDVDAIVSVATSNAKLFTNNKSKQTVASIVTKAYENLKDIWKLQFTFEGYVLLGWDTVHLIFDFDRKMEDMTENLEQFEGSELLAFYKNVGDVRDKAWSKVSDDTNSIFVVDDARYFATKN